MVQLGEAGLVAAGEQHPDAALVDQPNRSLGQLAGRAGHQQGPAAAHSLTSPSGVLMRVVTVCISAREKNSRAPAGVLVSRRSSSTRYLSSSRSTYWMLASWAMCAISRGR